MKSLSVLPFLLGYGERYYQSHAWLFLAGVRASQGKEALVVFILSIASSTGCNHSKASSALCRAPLPLPLVDLAIASYPVGRVDGISYPFFRASENILCLMVSLILFMNNVFIFWIAYRTPIIISCFWIEYWIRTKEIEYRRLQCLLLAFCKKLTVRLLRASKSGYILRLISFSWDFFLGVIGIQSDSSPAGLPPLPACMLACIPSVLEGILSSYNINMRILDNPLLDQRRITSSQSDSGLTGFKRLCSVYICILNNSSLPVSRQFFDSELAKATSYPRLLFKSPCLLFSYSLWNKWLQS